MKTYNNIPLTEKKITSLFLRSSRAECSSWDLSDCSMVGEAAG